MTKETDTSKEDKVKTSKSKSKPKKEKTPEELQALREKEKIKRLKMLFSSLTARRANFIYLNLLEPDTLVLTNLAPEKAIKFCNSTFSLHLLKLKDEETKEYIKEFFKDIKLDSITNISVVYITKILSMVNKVKWDTSKLEIETDRYGITTMSVDDEKHVPIAWPMSIFQLTLTIEKLYASYEKINSLEGIICYDLGDKVGDGINLVIPTKLSNYGLDDKKFNNINIVLLEGFDMVSTKEFIAKHDTFKIQNFNHKLITWTKDRCIDYASYYSNDWFDVISVRPSCKIFLKNFRKKPCETK